VAVVVLTAILPSLALGQEFYSPISSATAGASRFAGMSVVVTVQMSGPYISYWGDFRSAANELLHKAGFTVVEGRVYCPNRAKVIVAQFDVKKVGGIAGQIKKFGMAIPDFKITTSGHIELWVGDEMVGSEPFRGSDTAHGLALSYGQGSQAQLPNYGYNQAYGQGYGGYTPSYGQGGVALDATGQAGVYGPNGQWAQGGQTYGNALPMGYGGYAPTYAQGGAAQSCNGAGYYTPNGVWIQPGVNGAAANGYTGAPQGNGSVAISSQEFPDAENAIRKALGPAIRKLAQGR